MKNINNLINNVSSGQLAAIEELCLRLDTHGNTVIKVTETARSMEHSGNIIKESYVRDALKLMPIAEIIEYCSRAQAGNMVSVVDIETFNKLKSYFGLQIV